MRSVRTTILAFLAAHALAAPLRGELAPDLRVNNGSLQAFTVGDYILSWPGELNKRYLLQSSSDLRAWTTFSQVIGLGRECRIIARRKPAATDTMLRKFWRIEPFDFDSNNNGISDYDEDQLGTDPFLGSRIPLASPFAVFALCFPGWPLADQVAYCQNLGYDGIGFGGLPGEADLKKVAALPAIQSGAFHVYSALWSTTVTDTINWNSFDLSLAQAARLHMAIWMTVRGSKSTADIETAYARMKTAAQHCHQAGATLVLYPHVSSTFESSEEALALLLRLRSDPDFANTPKIPGSVRLSVHLCHELKMGNRDRLADIVKSVAPYCALATVSGTEPAPRSDPTWDTSIMPLDRGLYDVRLFLQALATAGYTGPMELHTYNLPNPKYDDHLERSLLRWRQLVAPSAP